MRVQTSALNAGSEVTIQRFFELFGIVIEIVHSCNVNTRLIYHLLFYWILLFILVIQPYHVLSNDSPIRLSQHDVKIIAFFTGLRRPCDTCIIVVIKSFGNYTLKE